MRPTACSRRVQNDRGGLGARPGLQCHDVVKASESLDLAPPFRCIGQKRDERLGKALRGAIILQQLRHDVFTKHKIGENDARQPLLDSRDPRDDFFNERDAIGGDGGNPR